MKNRRPRRATVFQVASLIGLLGALGGCTVGPDFARPIPPAITGYLPAGTTASLSSGFPTAIRFNWWHELDCPALDITISGAFAASPTIGAAQARLAQSQDELRAGRGLLLPAAGVSFDATRQRYSAASVGHAGTSGIFSLFTLAGTISYALDLFGGNRRTVEALQADTEQQQYVERGTYLTLASTLATAMIARAGYREQVQANQKLLTDISRQLSIAHARTSAGTGSYAAELELVSERASLEADFERAGRQRDQVDNLIAILAGQAPATWRPVEIGLDAFHRPAILPSRLPAELVRQRPDILAAEAAIHASSARIGVAKAAMLPNVTLTANFGSESGSMGQLLGAGTGIWGLGASLAAPLVNGGSLRFQHRAAIDAYRATVSDYRETVLEAFQQVADTLRALDHDQKIQEASERAAAASFRALHLVEINDHAGLAGENELLIADMQAQRDRIALITARAATLEDVVALYAALGGGWAGEQVLPANQVDVDAPSGDR